MRLTTLQGSSIKCSVLGFGCASLSSIATSDALRLLETAFDEGINHFDVARSYGYGVTEAILGRFLVDRRSDVTVTTKYGQGAVQVGARYRGAFSVAKQFVKQFPPVRRFAARAVASALRGAAFDSVTAARSLEKSLAELGTDYIDVFLLHEASFADAARDDIRSFLEKQVARGTIRAYGLGGDYGHLGGDVSMFPAGYRVFQFDDGPGLGHATQLVGGEMRALITFGVSRRVRRLADAARLKPKLVFEYARRIGEDLTDPVALQRLAITHAITMNPMGITLTSTVNAAHLIENAAAARAPTLPPNVGEAFSEFARLVLSEVDARPR